MVEIDSDLQEFTTRTDANIQSLFALVRDIVASQNGNKNIEQQYVRDIEKRLENIEKNEKKMKRKVKRHLETLYARVDALETSKSKNKRQNSETKTSEAENNKDQQVVTQKKSKWLRVKEKTVNYFKTISIPGIPQIVTTESYFSKFLCLALITVVFAFGFYNISLAVNDYYKFDKITNIERVNPDSVAFPAITICALGEYLRERYVNGRFISRDHIQIQTDNKLRIGNFLETDYGYTTAYINHLDFFKIPDRTDCFRFNAITNKSSGLVKSLDRNEKLFFFVRDFYYEDISESEYLNYSLVWPHLSVYIGDNHLNSFEVLDYVNLERGQFHEIEIEKDSIETKLPEPHNHCKGSVSEPYQQWNCIEACFYKEIKNKYNCSFPSFSSLNITQIAKTDGFTFLNNIGGGLGLFMGIAFPNLIEFCQFVFELVLIAFSR